MWNQIGIVGTLVAAIGLITFGIIGLTVFLERLYKKNVK
jgi:hypothetical protein